MYSQKHYQDLNQLFVRQSVAQKVKDFPAKIENNERLKLICSNFVEDCPLDLIEIYTYVQFRMEENSYNVLRSKFFDTQAAIDCVKPTEARGYKGIGVYDAANNQRRKKFHEQYFWSRMPKKPEYLGLWQDYGEDVFSNLSGVLKNVYNLFSKNAQVVDSYVADYNAKAIMKSRNYRELDIYAELDEFGRKMGPISNRSSIYKYGLPFNCLFSSGYNPYTYRPTWNSPYYTFVKISKFINSISTAGYIENSDVEKGLFSLFLVHIKREQQFEKMESPYYVACKRLNADEYINAHAAEDKKKLADDLAMLKLQPSEMYFIVKDYYVNYINEYLPKYQQLKMLEKLEQKHSSDVVINIGQTDLMTGYAFEYFVADILNKMGYKSQVTKATNDQGLDIIAVKGNFRLGVQTKRWDSSVGNKAIQEAVAGKPYYGVDQILVVTNNYFTREAISLARANNVMLWDRHDLEEKLKNV